MLLCGSTAWTQTLKITARVFNQAHVPQSVLVSAEKEAAYALGTAAVEALWVNCDRPGPCDEAVSPDEFEILVRETALPNFPNEGGVEAMGRCLLPRDQPGYYALAYYNEIRDFAKGTSGISTGEILGYVIAHEIGHLLLGADHQDGTIMQSRWGKVELEMIATRQLRFNRSQRAERKNARMAQNRTRRDQTLIAALLRAR